MLPGVTKCNKDDDNYAVSSVDVGQDKSATVIVNHATAFQEFITKASS